MMAKRMWTKMMRMKKVMKMADGDVEVDAEAKIMRMKMAKDTEVEAEAKMMRMKMAKDAEVDAEAEAKEAADVSG